MSTCFGTAWAPTARITATASVVMPFSVSPLFGNVARRGRDRGREALSGALAGTWTCAPLAPEPSIDSVSGGRRELGGSPDGWQGETGSLPRRLPRALGASAPLAEGLC